MAQKQQRDLEAQPRRLAKGLPGEKQGRRSAPFRRPSSVVQARRDFVCRLLDRGATDQQVLDALMKPPSTEPGKPGGLGLKFQQARHAVQDAKEHRRKLFAEESQRERSEQYGRLRGHIAGAVAAKQFGPVAQHEKLVMDLVGTRAPAPQAPRPERHEQIAAALANMSNDRIRELAAAARARRAAGEDASQEEDDA